MLEGLLKKRTYITVSSVPIKKEEKGKIKASEVRPTIPDGMWCKCPDCGAILYNEDVEKNLGVCNKCNYHFRIDGKYRLNLVADEGTFEEFFGDITSVDPLNFEGYKEKLVKAEEKASIKEAVITGTCKIDGKKVAIGVMDSNFMMGSMGTVVGEKITRLIELATDEALPLIIFTTSGGARMQEGIFSLMQMAKISGALKRHSLKGLLYIAFLTDPTTGGVTASFAMEGDIILSEPGTLIGFAGRRVIENTINQELPKNFQRAEFLLEKGFIDSIINRKELKEILSKILKLHEVK
ncbi:acetyl-CoA carboxylase, carboxyltransferase subunit beta [Clostridium sp. YIM B02551]|uniref:acetyl-CoA carboxylase, carboxyltransferase subunit beta n=1 Tax=Clostridium sp. YIM B02551 TaxID=2910679 RepID=UPI001EE9BAE4|nr:acetyl-CoA carboxylase, carboxyltransferase subunit beta [Clostridium sp. YIM B02551]